MNIFMIGGTGLLGCEAAKVLLEKGHKVTSVALPPLPQGAPIPEKMEIILEDINKKTDDEIYELLRGKDCFVFAAGVDERVEFPYPVEKYYDKYNIAPLKRIFPICKKAGVKRAVVLGSYFSYLSKLHPEMKLTDKNPYFKSRIEQEQVCESFCDDTFSAAVLELPYIFGTQPGRKPVWTILIEQIEFMDKWPFTMYPGGGTAMLTCRQVGQVIAGACERKKYGFEAIPIGMYNMTWKQLLDIVYRARKMPGRKIVSVSPLMMKMGMVKVSRDYKKRGIDSGMDPFNLPDIMDIKLFINNSYAKNLGATEDNIEDAITDSIIVSEQSFRGKVKLLEMKGE